VGAAGRVEVVLGLVPVKLVGVDGGYYGVKARELSANRRVCNGGYKSGKSGRDVVLSVEGQVTFHVKPVTRPGVSSLSECERICCQALLEMNVQGSGLTTQVIPCKPGDGGGLAWRVLNVKKQVYEVDK
jgi:hypothetical protein